MIGVIGDMHFKDNLSYADYISDRRISEKSKILDFIVESFKDCRYIVFLGDNFNSKNNSSETNRAFVEFVERFNDKEVFIIAGNHEKKGDGKSAIDFLSEVKKPNWHIFVRPGTMSFLEKTSSVGPSTFVPKTLKLDFLPFMSKSELGTENQTEATKYVMDHLGGGDILFAHHAITGTIFNGLPVDTWKEVVLPKNEIENKYKLVMAGHIHEPRKYGKSIVTGSVFTDCVGETKKFIWKIDESLKVIPIELPCRPILKLENPTTKDLDEVPNNAILKVVLTDKSIYVEELKKSLKKFDASLIIENYTNDRKKIKIDKDAAFDFSIENLLKLYAEERKISLVTLMSGYELIK